MTDGRWLRALIGHFDELQKHEPLEREIIEERETARFSEHDLRTVGSVGW